MKWLKQLIKNVYRKNIHHSFIYKEFGGIKKLRRQCPYCKQRFVLNSNARFSWYESINGIILNPKCTCHNWKESRIKRKENK